MTTTYTKIPKASGTTYVNVSSGIVQYDDSATIYDSPTVNYDGGGNSWTSVAKPRTTYFSTWTESIPYRWSDLGTLTWADIEDLWIKIPKAT